MSSEAQYKQWLTHFSGQAKQLQDKVSSEKNPALKNIYKQQLTHFQKEAQKQQRNLEAANEVTKQSAGKERELITDDSKAGIAFAKKELGLGNLGRLDTKRLQDLSKGLSAEELQANRDRASQEINRSTQTTSRQLQAIQAQQGMRGATAGSQQLSVLQQGDRNKQDFERDLFLEDRNARVQGLQNLQDTQQFNLQQAAQEKYDLAQSGLAFSQMGLSNRGGDKAIQAQQAAAAAQQVSCFAGDTLIVLGNGNYKPIKDIEIGDVLATGSIVYGKMHFACAEPAYLLDGVAVTGKHKVLVGRHYIEVEQIGGLDRVELGDVYNLCTSNHVIVAKGETRQAVFSDYDEE